LVGASLGSHTVTLPMSNGNLTPESAGASLVVIYRERTLPLRKISINDGIYIQAQGGTLIEHLRGFFRSAIPASARVTQLAAAGAKNQTAVLSFNGVPLSANAFQAGGSQSDRTWFTRTDNVSQLMSLN